MTQPTLWTRALGALLLAAAVAGCGDSPTTLVPVTRSDAGVDAGEEVIIAGPDASVRPSFDAGPIAVDEERTLNIVGDPRPVLGFGDSVELTALLVGSGVGGVPNVPVTFTVTGGGGLDQLVATTDEAGLVRVVFTAGTSAGKSMVEATAPKVPDDKKATWVLTTNFPSREMKEITSRSLGMTDKQPVKTGVKLSENGKPLAGGRITFKLLAPRNGVRINGKDLDSDVVTTGPDGVARVQLSVANVVDAFALTMEASEQYAGSLLFTVQVKPADPVQCPATPCPAGEFCENGICVKKGCTSPADCGNGYNCEMGVCVRIEVTCTASAQCPAGSYCDPNLHVCVKGCDADSQCPAAMPNCVDHQCVGNAVCTKDEDCAFPLVCDVASGKCVPVLDVSGEWSAVQAFHVAGLTPPGVQSALTKIQTIFGAAQQIADCHVSHFLPDWLKFLVGGMVDKAVCDVMGDYVPTWVKTVINIVANVSRMVDNFEIHSKMTIEQAEGSRAVTGTDEWNTAVFFWYRTGCSTPAPGQPPPQCALVELDLASAMMPCGVDADCGSGKQCVSGYCTDWMIKPTPSQFTGSVERTKLQINTHKINFNFGGTVMTLLNQLISWQTGYTTLQEALNDVVDCGQINSWIRDVVRGILGQYADWADAIDVTGLCEGTKQGLVAQLTTLIFGLNSDVPMSLVGNAGIVQAPGNTSNVADRLAPGVWYGQFNGQGSNSKAFGEWYADRP